MMAEMIVEALQEHDEIYPTSACENIEDGFRVQLGKLQFWFNDAKGDSHMISREVKEGEVL